MVLGGLDTIHDPQRWRQSWWDDFCKSHPGFQYRTDLLACLLSAAALRTGQGTIASQWLTLRRLPSHPNSVAKLKTRIRGTSQSWPFLTVPPWFSVFLTEPFKGPDEVIV